VAPSVDVLERLLRERHLWDDDIVKWRVVERLDSQTEVFQYVVKRHGATSHPGPLYRDGASTRKHSVSATDPDGKCNKITRSQRHLAKAQHAAYTACAAPPIEAV